MIRKLYDFKTIKKLEEEILIYEKLMLAHKKAIMVSEELLIAYEKSIRVSEKRLSKLSPQQMRKLFRGILRTRTSIKNKYTLKELYAILDEDEDDLEKPKEPIDKEPIDKEPIDKEPIDKEPIDKEPIDKEPIDIKPIDIKPIDIKPIDKIKYKKQKSFTGRSSIAKPNPLIPVIPLTKIKLNPNLIINYNVHSIKQKNAILEVNYSVTPTYLYEISSQIENTIANVTKPFEPKSSALATYWENEIAYWDNFFMHYYKEDLKDTKNILNICCADWFSREKNNPTYFDVFSRYYNRTEFDVLSIQCELIRLNYWLSDTIYFNMNNIHKYGHYKDLNRKNVIREEDKEYLNAKSKLLRKLPRFPGTFYTKIKNDIYPVLSKSHDIREIRKVLDPLIKEIKQYVKKTLESFLDFVHYKHMTQIRKTMARLSDNLVISFEMFLEHFEFLSINVRYDIEKTDEFPTVNVKDITLNKNINDFKIIMYVLKFYHSKKYWQFFKYDSNETQSLFIRSVRALYDQMYIYYLVTIYELEKKPSDSLKDSSLLFLYNVFQHNSFDELNCSIFSCINDKSLGKFMQVFSDIEKGTNDNYGLKLCIEDVLLFTKVIDNITIALFKYNKIFFKHWSESYNHYTAEDYSNFYKKSYNKIFQNKKFLKDTIYKHPRTLLIQGSHLKNKLVDLHFPWLDTHMDTFINNFDKMIRPIDNTLPEEQWIIAEKYSDIINFSTYPLTLSMQAIGRYFYCCICKNLDFNFMIKYAPIYVGFNIHFESFSQFFQAFGFSLKIIPEMWPLFVRQITEFNQTFGKCLLQVSLDNMGYVFVDRTCIDYYNSIQPRSYKRLFEYLEVLYGSYENIPNLKISYAL